MANPRPTGKSAPHEVLGIKDIATAVGMSDEEIARKKTTAIAAVDDTQWPEEYKSRKRAAIESAYQKLKNEELRKVYEGERHKELYADLAGRLLLGDGVFVKDTALQEKMRHQNNEPFEKQYKDIKNIIENRGTRTPPTPPPEVSPAPGTPSVVPPPPDLVSPPPGAAPSAIPAASNPVSSVADSGWGKAKVGYDTGVYQGNPCVRITITGEPHEINAVLKSFAEKGYKLVQLKDQEKKQEAGPGPDSDPELKGPLKGKQH